MFSSASSASLTAVASALYGSQSDVALSHSVQAVSQANAEHTRPAETRNTHTARTPQARHFVTSEVSRVSRNEPVRGTNLTISLTSSFCTCRTSSIARLFNALHQRNRVTTCLWNACTSEGDNLRFRLVIHGCSDDLDFLRPPVVRVIPQNTLALATIVALIALITNAAHDLTRVPLCVINVFVSRSGHADTPPVATTYLVSKHRAQHCGHQHTRSAYTTCHRSGHNPTHCTGMRTPQIPFHTGRCRLCSRTSPATVYMVSHQLKRAMMASQTAMHSAPDSNTQPAGVPCRSLHQGHQTTQGPLDIDLCSQKCTIYAPETKVLTITRNRTAVAVRGFPIPRFVAGTHHIVSHAAVSMSIAVKWTVICAQVDCHGHGAQERNAKQSHNDNLVHSTPP
jgi:hypothetical protein